MIYGRRLFDKSHEGPFHKEPAHRVFRVVNSKFQWKYTLSLMIFLLVALSFFMAPSWYLLSQNYAIFNRLARVAEPQLLEHLRREIWWLVGFSVFSITSLIVVTTWVGLKMTANIIGPLISMERHIWKVTSGDWSSPDFKIRSEDDFRDLAEAYSYLYRSLKAQAEAELKLLEKVHIQPEQRDAYNALHSLMDLKRKQMNLKPTEVTWPNPAIHVVPNEAPGSRRAS
jgi:hypothetical protein